VRKKHHERNSFSSLTTIHMSLRYACNRDTTFSTTAPAPCRYINRLCSKPPLFPSQNMERR